VIISSPSTNLCREESDGQDVEVEVEADMGRRPMGRWRRGRREKADGQADGQAGGQDVEVRDQADGQEAVREVDAVEQEADGQGVYGQ
jgi:hypothetical protein